MKSKDVKELTRVELSQQFKTALESGDEAQVAQAFADMADNIQQAVLEKAKDAAAVDQMDAAALAARGLRQLTSEEKKYYEKVINAMKSDNPKQALANLDVTMPKTIIEDVFDSLKAEHKLLSVIDFNNTSYVTEWILNKNGKQKAVWGDITAEIEKELSGEFEKLDMIMFSLTAFMPVAKSMQDLGPVWLDSYVRQVLQDALYVGIEEGVVCGTGVKMPIGMMKDIGAAHVDGEPYPDKEAIKVTELTPEVYGELIGKMAVSRNNRPRAVGEVIMVVNPVDYWRKVMPATTIQRPDGTYANNVLPYPTDVIQSEEMPAGKAVLGIAKQYFMGIGTGKDGVIEYDDSYKFLQRERVYAGHLYGNGKPKDNNSFLVLDISELQPAVYMVYAQMAAAAEGVAAYTAEPEIVEKVVEKKVWTEKELNNMTVDQIEGLAAYMKYTINGGNKSEKIASFLAAQTAAGSN
ncbi:MAG: phage major capsid protein [Lachnospiraceae bacterium]|nr:phage major capsid protein [Lachnospiraceae bacterium]MBD5505975.1 phage major capsid protein [Lachnospiraceae bacterium]